MIAEFPRYILTLLICILKIKSFKCFSENYTVSPCVVLGEREICPISSRVCVLFVAVVFVLEDKCLYFLLLCECLHFKC